MKPLQPKVKMNKTEAEWAWILEVQKRAGEIVDYKYEPFNVRLAGKTFYRVDFLVVCPGHFEFHEIKGGYIHDDALVKFKTAAELYPWFRWKMIQKVSKREGFKVIKEI